MSQSSLTPRLSLAVMCCAASQSNAQTSSPQTTHDVTASTEAVNRGGLGASGPVNFGAGPAQHEDTSRDACVTHEMQTRIRADIDAFRDAHPCFLERTTQTYDFHPQAGTWQRDLSFGLFVDLDPTSNFLSFDCGSLTYDSHAGIDSGLRTFAEQVIGVPVFAALPGIVVARHDGDPDMNTQPTTDDGNYVILDHGAGMETWYFHMRNGSVAPLLGEHVVAGQQLGMTASSGHSFGPHLHFQTMLNGVPYEPNAGPCRAGPSLWTHQNTFSFSTYIADAAISYVDLATVPGNPFDVPRTGQLALTDDYHWIWTQIQNLPPNSTFRFRWIRPNGTLSYQSDTFPFNNPTYYDRAWTWFWWWINDMHTTTGTWHIQMDINGVQQADLPVEVRTQRTPDFNRPPAALQSLEFDPAAPQPGATVFCRINTDLVLDDPDYDVVRYHYVWTLDGQVIRDVTTAGHADAIQSGLTSLGQTLQCTVTPSDALLSAPSSTITATIGGVLCDSIDFNNDGSFFDPQDIDAFLSVYSEGPCVPESASCNDIDFNNDASLFDPCDIDSFLSAYSEGPCTLCGT